MLDLIWAIVLVALIVVNLIFALSGGPVALINAYAAGFVSASLLYHIGQWIGGQHEFTISDVPGSDRTSVVGPGGSGAEEHAPGRPGVRLDNN